jgi:ATP-binding cassette subfamily C protein LapB
MRNLSALATNGTLFIQQFSGMATIVAGVYSIIAGNLSVGALVASYMLGSRVLAPLGQIAGLITRYQQAQLTMKSTDALMGLPQERDAKQRPLERTQLQGALDVVGVTFHYNGQNNAALANVSFSVKPGERIGIIGRSGSGKSTLARLVMGFYEPEEGQLLLDGLDLRQLDVADLRHQIGYVAHDLPLLAGSLRDNLTLGARYISDSRMLEVAELTGVTELARQHPQGSTGRGRARTTALRWPAPGRVAGGRCCSTRRSCCSTNPPAPWTTAAKTCCARSCTAGCKARPAAGHPPHLDAEPGGPAAGPGQRPVVADGPKEAVIDALRKGRVGSAAV